MGQPRTTFATHPSAMIVRHGLLFRLLRRLAFDRVPVEPRLVDPLRLASAGATPVYLLRYAITNDTLTLELPDDRAVAHRIVDGKIRGETHKTENSLTNRLLAPVDPAALREAGFFDGDKGVLRRATTKKKR